MTNYQKGFRRGIDDAHYIAEGWGYGFGDLIWHYENGELHMIMWDVLQQKDELLAFDTKREQEGWEKGFMKTLTNIIKNYKKRDPKFYRELLEREID